MHDQTTATHGMPLQHGDRSPQKKATLTSNIGALRHGKRSQHQKEPALTKFNGAHLLKWVAAFCVLDCVGATELSAVCKPTAPICTREYVPVCGKDGVTTYSNQCLANAACQLDGSTKGECSPSAGPSAGCTVKIDVVLVLDDSGSVLTSNSVGAMKSFAKAIVSGFDLGDDLSRVAVVTFASDATLRTGLAAELNPINNAIDQLKGSGSTSISDGLERAQREFALRARSDAGRVVIVLSDGEQTTDCLNGDCQKTAIDAATPLKAGGATVFSWGFGTISMDTLKRIASSASSDHARFGATVDGLQEHVAELIARTCLSPLPPSAPPSPPSPPVSVDTGGEQDPHLHLAHQGKADWRGWNNTYFPMLSAPGVHFAVLTTDTDFRLPMVRLVHGSFFTDVSWVLRGLSNRMYAIVSSASKIGFDVLDANQSTTTVVAQRKGVWQSWKEDGILAFYKHQTLFVRANGWEVNATREPIYNLVHGASHWRFDIAMRKLDGTIFAKEFGDSSASCFPHGIIGQSYDGDNMAVSGKTDDYTNRVEVTTTAMAEGAIEGSAADYALSGAFDTGFKYSRFARMRSDECAPRDVSKLTGFKGLAKGNTEAISTSEEDDTNAAAPVKQE